MSTGVLIKLSGVRCEDDLEDLQQIARGGVDLVQLRSAQERLLDLANHARHQYNTTGVFPELADLDVDARTIIRDTFVNGAWPAGMSPMPLVLSTFAQICKDKGDSPGQLRYSLEATLSLRERIGSAWVHMLFDTVQSLAFFIQSNAYDIPGEDAGLSEDVCWNVLHGYLGMLKRAATHIYGSDSAYTQSISNWYLRAVGSAQSPLPGTRRFVRVLERSQAKMLRWAGIEDSRGVSLPK
jgi:SET and MYND domain-containing protein